ncbi:hypothetical protein QJ854_gp579 [Moumouvirus goulette]|uniref:Uncharacterized protein n=1 Tax=Moumouvirus goulette TaxID=1247379 RepID=M1PGR3_9VIRU|nr:hypothetical protein QJ854_gp579 [Moumouvirus goulette]AGF85203.1 hypothetical protein glt_00394 [Moumouvirus goulette]
MFYLGTFLIINKCSTNIFIQFAIGCIGYIIILYIFQKNLPKDCVDKYFYFWIFLIITDIFIWIYLRTKCHKIKESNDDNNNINSIDNDKDEIISDSEDYTITHSSISESDNIMDSISNKSDTIFI